MKTQRSLRIGIRYAIFGAAKLGESEANKKLNKDTVKRLLNMTESIFPISKSIFANVESLHKKYYLYCWHDILQFSIWSINCEHYYVI